jgi:hypothetical protein
MNIAICLCIFWVNVLILIIIEQFPLHQLRISVPAVMQGGKRKKNTPN